MNMKRNLVIHPLLIALFPVLSLWSYNISLVSFTLVFRPALIVIGFAFITFLISVALIKDCEKAGIILSLFLALFFSYGRTFNGIRESWVGDPSVVKYFYLTLACCALFILISWSVIKTQRNLNTITRCLNVIATVLVALPLIQIGFYEITEGGFGKNAGFEEMGEAEADSVEAGWLPDVYYIILDGYARQDVLEEVYDFDDSEFIEYLEGEGFYVAGKSTSNYAQTYLSLASSLNLNYVDNLGGMPTQDSYNRKPLRGMIINSRVHNFLKRNGYKFVSFSNGDPVTEQTNADVYIKPRLYFTEFDNLLLGTTPIPDVVYCLRKKFPALRLYTQYMPHRTMILHTFDSLEKPADISGPVFVFAHIMIPHPPFVFGQNGEEVNTNRRFSLNDGSHTVFNEEDRRRYVEDYRNQLVFTNKKIRAALNEILRKSDRPAVIILQSDHGPGSRLDWENPEETYMKERMSILNAVYLPETSVNDTQFYESMTPVNIFRMIFNRYFGTGYELLEDRSYFSTWSHPYELIPVTFENSSLNATKSVPPREQ